MTELIIIHGVPTSGPSILGECIRILGIQSLNDNVQLSSTTIHSLLCQELNHSDFMIGALPDGWTNSQAGEIAKERLNNIFLKSQNRNDEFPLWISDHSIITFFPLWQTLFKKFNITPKFVHLIRHPWEVASSIKSKFNMSSEKAYVFWLQYLKDSINAYNDFPSLLITYDQLIFDPVTTLFHIQDKLKLAWPNDIYHFSKDLIKFIQPSYRQHHASNMSVHDRAQFAVYYKVFDQIKSEPLKVVFSDNFSNLFDNLCRLIGQIDMKHLDYNQRTSDQIVENAVPLCSRLIGTSKNGEPQFDEKILIPIDKWHHCTMELSDNISFKDIDIRFIPVNSHGTIIISTINLVKKIDNSVVWSANQDNNFDCLSIDSDSIRIPDPMNMHLISNNSNPTIRLSNFEKIEKEESPLIFEAWLMVHKGTESIQKYLHKIENDILLLEEKLTTRFMKEIDSLKSKINSEKSKHIQGFAYRDSQGHLPNNYLILITLHRCGSTFLMDAIRTHPHIYIEPRAFLQEHANLIPGRYPVDLVTDKEPYIDIEQSPGKGCRIPILGSKQRPGPIQKQITDESFAIEKIHPEFFGYCAEQFFIEIDNIEKQFKTNFRFIYVIRDPKSTISSFIKYKRRNKNWYKNVPEKDVSEFMRKEYQCLYEVIYKKHGLIIDYVDLIKNFENTLQTIFKFLWPGDNNASYEDIIRQARVHTDRKMRLSDSATPFLGPDIGSIEGGDDDLNEYFNDHKDVIENLYEFYDAIHKLEK